VFCTVYCGHFLCLVVFCLFIWLGCAFIEWDDLSLKWPIICWWGTWTLLIHL